MADALSQCMRMPTRDKTILRSLLIAILIGMGGAFATATSCLDRGSKARIEASSTKDTTEPFPSSPTDQSARSAAGGITTADEPTSTTTLTGAELHADEGPHEERGGSASGLSTPFQFEVPVPHTHAESTVPHTHAESTAAAVATSPPPPPPMTPVPPPAPTDVSAPDASAPLEQPTAPATADAGEAEGAPAPGAGAYILMPAWVVAPVASPAVPPTP